MLILVSFKSTKTQQVGNNIKIIRNSSYIDLALSQASLFPCLEPWAHCLKEQTTLNFHELQEMEKTCSEIEQSVCHTSVQSTV